MGDGDFGNGAVIGLVGRGTGSWEYYYVYGAGNYNGYAGDGDTVFNVHVGAGGWAWRYQGWGTNAGAKWTSDCGGGCLGVVNVDNGGFNWA